MYETKTGADKERQRERERERRGDGDILQKLFVIFRIFYVAMALFKDIRVKNTHEHDKMDERRQKKTT